MHCNNNKLQLNYLKELATHENYYEEILDWIHGLDNIEIREWNEQRINKILEKTFGGFDNLKELNHEEEFIKEITPLLHKYFYLNPEREDGRSECQADSEERIEGEAKDLYSELQDDYWLLHKRILEKEKEE